MNESQDSIRKTIWAMMSMIEYYDRACHYTYQYIDLVEEIYTGKSELYPETTEAVIELCIDRAIEKLKEARDIHESLNPDSLPFGGSTPVESVPIA